MAKNRSQEDVSKMLRWSERLLITATNLLLLGAILPTPVARADAQNDFTGFSPNHAFEGALAGENVDLLTGNVNLKIPIGPKFMLNDDFGYQVALYYNSKIWEHDCRNQVPEDPDGECTGTIIASDTYGLGFRIHFGRIFQRPKDKPDVWIYQTPDGAEHFFIKSIAGNYTIDGSSIFVRFQDNSPPTADYWEAWPGDGTKITFGKDAGSDRAWGGWYATKIETVEQGISGPAQWVNVVYSTIQDRIESLDDSAGRTIDFDWTLDPMMTIKVPAYAGNTALRPLTVAVYEFHRTQITVYDPGALTDPAKHPYGLTRLVYPDPPLNYTTEDYEFEYFRTGGDGPFGYLLARKTPMGARAEYHYKHYATGPGRPAHSELVLKKMILGPKTYRWSYTRFGDGLIRDENDVDLYEAGVGYSASNPSTVRVLDPFDNLTISWFENTIYDKATESCPCECNPEDECRNFWDDGLMVLTETYTGSTPDGARLVSRTAYEYTYDGQMFQYRQPAGLVIDGYSVAINPRVASVQITTPGGGNSPSKTRKTVYSNWTPTIPLPRIMEEYDGDVLYRTTETDWDPSKYFHGDHRYVELRDAAGQVLSRTERHFWVDRLECEVNRKVPGNITFDDCYDPPLDVSDGGVATVNSFDLAGNLESTTVWDSNSSRFVTFTYAAGGYLQTKNYGFSWNATDRTIDFNTGLPISSRDPAGTETRYTWDALGRLTQIAPTGPEKPTDITYTDLHQTEVRQNVTGGNSCTGNSNCLSTIYHYDDLGRVIEVQKRSISINGSSDSQKTEYDIAGRMTRRSEWAVSGTPDADRKWTTYDYTAFTDTSTSPVTKYPDPLGRLRSLTVPDDTTPTTPTQVMSYQGLATTVTTHDIRGFDSATNQDKLIPSTTVYIRDVFDRLVRVDSPGTGADADYVYDERDDLVEVHLKDPAVPAKDQVRRFSYDALGRLRRAMEPESGTTEYLSYDASGNLLKYKDARQNVFKATYDAAGRLTTRCLGADDDTPCQPGGSDVLMENTYDVGVGAAAGKLVQQNSYKIHNKCSVTQTTSCTTNADCPAGELCNNNVLISVANFAYGSANGSSSCALVPLAPAFAGLNGRIKSQWITIYPWDKAVQIDFCQNQLGLPYLVAYPDFFGSGRTRSLVGHNYNNGYFWEQHDAGRNFQYIKNVEYGPGGVVTEVTRGNDVKDYSDRDMRGRPSQIRVDAPGSQDGGGGGGGGGPNPPPLDDVGGCGGPGGSFLVFIEQCGGGEGPEGAEAESGPRVPLWNSGNYAYDVAGNVQTIGSNQYYYDELSRLIRATEVPSSGLLFTSSFEYDAFGNMLRQSRKATTQVTPNTRDYVVDWKTNRLSSQTHSWFGGSKTIDYAFDENGNMTAETTTTSGRGYVFGPDGRLEKVTEKTEGGVVGVYDYDANGYRVRAESDGTETFYFRDGSGQVLSEFRRKVGDTADPSWDKDYVYALGKVFAIVKNEDPAPPKRPWATAVTPTSLILNWEAVEEPDLFGYKIERRLKLQPSDPEPQPVTYNVGKEIQSFADAFAAVTSPNTTVKYIVFARDTAQNEAASPELTVRPAELPPPAPQNLMAVPLDRAIQLRWDPVTTRDDLWGYYVERIAPGDAGFVRITPMVVEKPEFRDVGLQNGSSYTYQVRAVDTSGRVSLPSVNVATTPIDNVPPSKPTGVRAEAARAAGAIRVTWDRVTDPDLAAYEVFREYIGAWEPAGVVDVTPTSHPDEFTDSVPIAGIGYHYRVRAVDTTGNRSPYSDYPYAFARPRDPSIDVPTLQSAVFEVDDKNTPSQDGIRGSGQEDGGDIEAEDDDVIQVRVTWVKTLDAQGYRIYRAVTGSPQFSAVGDVAATAGEFVDTQTVGANYTYYVVAKKVVGSFEEESAASGTPTPGVTDRAEDVFPPGTFVRNLVAQDGFEEYFTQNQRSRMVRVFWSRVPERKLVGYHVYRKCEWGYMEHPITEPSTSAFTCRTSWERVTQQPVTDARRFVEDRNVGGLNGAYIYAVRPVGPDYLEGAMKKGLNVDLLYGPVPFNDQNYPHTDADDATETPPWNFCYDPPTGEATNAMLDRISSIGRGLAPDVGAPFKPSSVRVSWTIKEPAHCQGGPRRTKVATVSWTRNQQTQERDLAGYHVEMAGSYYGPWLRMTPTPVAWWETSQVFQGLGIERSSGIYSGHTECMHFRVIAVDENGNESEPAYPTDGNGQPIYPLSNCNFPATPPAPNNLRATTNGGAGAPGWCQTRLEWNAVPGAVEYYVWRFTVYNCYHFYDTQKQAAMAGANKCSVTQTTSCTTNADCPAGEFCNNVETYIEDGDPDAFSGIPNSDCGCTQSGVGNCDTGNLDAFYVTARGVNGGESPRSNIVFWDCDANPGYARLMGSPSPMTEAIAWLGPEDSGLEGSEDMACWEVPRGGGEEEGIRAGFLPVSEFNLATADRFQSAAPPLGVTTASEPLVHPLLTLGSGNPAWKLVDLHTDHLGSVRLVTVGGKISSQHDYFPFGEEAAPMISYNNHQFTGHERDRDTGLDYMLARYYGAALSRFLSIDSGDDTDPVLPQTFNAYMYVRNNPLIGVDLNGRDTYLVNRELGGDSPRPRDDIITHTFVVTTDEHGNIEHTYSWGNDPDPKNAHVEGKWFMDESEDIKAAEGALKLGVADKVGDASLDPYVDKAFQKHANKADDPSNHRNMIVCNNCKTEAGKLVDEAKKLEKEAQQKQQPPQQQGQQGGKQQGRVRKGNWRHTGAVGVGSVMGRMMMVRRETARPKGDRFGL